MKTFVYISSWTHGKETCGIGVYELDQAGTMKFVERAEQETSFNTTFVDRERGLLYALNETDSLPGRRGGGGRVFVFRFDRESGRLTKIGCTPTWCANPCYMAIDKEKKYAVVAHHGGFSAVTKTVRDAEGRYRLLVEQDDVAVELFALKEDGTLGELLDVVKHEPGSSDRKGASAHPHSAVMSPDGKLFAVCDKGSDTVRMYAIDRETEKLYLKGAPRRYPSGTKPRYCVFHPSKPYFYHNNEHDMDLYAYRYDEEGRLDPIGAYSTLPEGYVPGPGVHEQQGLCIHPNGRFLYDIARGPDLACVFQIDEETGAVTKLQSQLVADGWPRGCAISPDGRFFIVCGLKAGKVFLYSVGEDGRLTDTGVTVDQFGASYVSFLQI